MPWGKGRAVGHSNVGGDRLVVQGVAGVPGDARK